MNTPSSIASSADSLPELRTQVIFFSNEFPSDGLSELFRRLHRHSKDKRFPNLTAFLAESIATIKDEASRLPSNLRDLIPSCDSMLTLADHSGFRHGPLGAAVESALLTALEIAMLIGHYERNELPYDLPSTRPTLAGLSIGIIAAAAVASSSSLADLVHAGAESVRISFRLGVFVDDVSRSLENTEGEGNVNSWAYVVTGLDAEEVQAEIDVYNRETLNPEMTKVFISASDKSSVSVTGPPSRLKAAFQASAKLRYAKWLALPVFDGLCHASHVYDTDDIATVIRGSEAKWPVSKPVRLPLLSSQTGQPFTARTSGALYEEIGAELLTGTIYLDNVTRGVLDHISDSEAAECQLSLFRMSIVSKGLIAAIESDLPHIAISREDFLDWSAREYETRLPRTDKQSKLAVVGMSCRMPGGADTNELFWKLLQEGKDTCTKIPSDRFDLESHFDPTGKTENATQTPYGNFIHNPGLFDAAFFNMSPREAEQVDPMARLALVTAYEALEMAGYAPNRTPSTRLGRVGTFYGQASDDWRELNGSQNISTYAVPGGERAFANGRVNYFFNFGGPSFNIDTACSSGLAAVQAACSALWAGEADTVIAGGLNIITDPDNYAGLGNAHFLSLTGQCKVWDATADGYCRADGVGSVVIKRLEDAEADNDNIISVILSGATNHSAEAISITHPHAGAQRANYNQVMRGAGVNPLDVSYVELHGTGTQAGDKIESESVGDIFAPANPCRRGDQKLLLGAVKSNIGHGEAAAGIASFIKLLLCYRHNEIPAHIGIKTEINPTIPKSLLGKRGAQLVLENTEWPRKKQQKRLAVVNSFGAHGGNTTLLLEDAPIKRKIGTDPRSVYPFVISAKSKPSLNANLKALLSYIDQHPDVDLGDLSYTLCARRFHHNFRLGSTAADTAGLRKWLETAIENSSNTRSSPIDPPGVVFAFCGQGAFYQGMASQLFKEFPMFRTHITKLDKLVTGLGYPSLIPNIEGTASGDVTPVTSQLAITVVEIALVRLWAQLGVKPNYVIGHSLGEYAALVAAGVISAADAIMLVGRRAEKILAACTAGSHVMLSIRAKCELTTEFLQKSCKGADKWEVSCINGPNHWVVSGSRADMEATRKVLEEDGMQCNWVDVPFAFHTAQVDPILDDLEQLASQVTFKTPCVPVISPLLGRTVFDGKTINAEYIRRACREPVNYVAALRAAQDDGLVNKSTVFVDIGPHPIAAGIFVRSLLPEAKTAASLKRGENAWTMLAQAMSTLHCESIEVGWNEFFRPYERAHDLLELDSYVWNNKNYWIPYYGTWTLDKASAKNGPSQPSQPAAIQPHGSALKTSLIHQVLKEEITESAAELVVLSDMTQPDFQKALHGHMMNGYGVATSSIWCDMILVLSEYLHRRVFPKVTEVHPKVTGFECFHGQVAQKDKTKPQLLHLEAQMDIATKSVDLKWFNVDSNGERGAEAFAICEVHYEEPSQWQTEWNRVEHLITGRIDTLSSMADDGTANKLLKNMAYTLFKNVVDYAPAYRGMTSVVLHDYEAFANIELHEERLGTWHTPPHWIDSVSHLAGLVMNGSDASNTKDFFYVTPGYDTFCMSEELTAGAKYQAYVKMLPTSDPHIHAGDVYILRDGSIIGLVGGMKFRRVPRIMMDTFFSPPDAKNGHKSAAVSKQSPAPKPAAAAPAATPVKKTTTVAAATTRPPTPPVEPAAPAAPPKPATQPATVPVTTEITPPATPPSKPVDASTEAQGGEEEDDNPVLADFSDLLSKETGLDVAELSDDRSFAEIGVDSLMSLVLSAKMRDECGVDVKSSLFIECPTIGELKAWLVECV